MKLKRPLRGSENGADVRMVQRALNRWTHPSITIPVTGVYDRTTRDRMMAFQADQDVIPASGKFGQRSLTKLWPFFDAYGKMRYRLFRVPKPKPKLPALGPIFKGGQSVLVHDLTHATDGLDLYPAFDDAFFEGAAIIAPEAIEVTRESHSVPGLAFYATGRSRLRYWFGHLDRTHPPGTKFRKGELVGKTCPNSVGGGPHCHLGINVELIAGAGKELEHHTDYTHGAPTVAEQLRKLV